MRIKRSGLGVGVVALTTLCLAACSSSSGGASAGNSPASGEQIKVALVVHLQNPLTEEMQRGAQVAADELNADLTLAGPQGLDTAAEIQMFNDAIVAGAKGVAVVPYPADLWERALADASKKGVKLAAFSVPVPNLTAEVPLYVGVNEKDLGRAIAQLALDKLGADPHGQVVIGNCVPGLDVLTNRVDGIKEVLSEKAPNIEIVGDFDTTGDATTNYAAWESYMIKYKDALAFAGVCSFDLANMTKAKEKLNTKGILVGNDFDPDVLRGLESGIVAGSVGQSPFVQGYATTRALIEAIRDGEDPASGWLDAGLDIVPAESSAETIANYSSDEAYKTYWTNKAHEVFDQYPGSVATLQDLVE